jgi:hypothetical protein
MAHFPVVPEGRTPGVKHGYEELDVFKNLPDGDIVWCGSFSNFEAAKTRIDKLLASDPGEYFIHSYPTGRKLFFKANGHNGAGKESRYSSWKSTQQRHACQSQEGNAKPRTQPAIGPRNRT